MAAYELILMVDSDLPEDRRTEVVDSARRLIESNGGKTTGDQSWGTRKLSYEIDHRTEALYHQFDYDAAPTTVEPLSTALRITEGVLRFRVLNRLERKQSAPPAQPPQTAEPVAEAVAEPAVDSTPGPVAEPAGEPAGDSETATAPSQP